MVTQSDLVNPKSLEECGSYGNTDDDFEEYSEEEIPSEEESNENLRKPPNKEGSCDKISEVEGSHAEEPNVGGSSDEESAEEVPSGEGSGDEDSCAEEPDEENSDEEPNMASEEYPTEGTALEEASDEDPTEDLSFEEIIEEELSDESEEEPDGEEPLRGSMDQLPLVTVRDVVPSLLEEKKASHIIFSESKTTADSSCSQYLRESSNLSTDAIVSKQPDVPLASRKKRCSRWDIKAPMLVNDSGDLVKRRKTRWSSDINAEAPMLVNDSADLDKRRKTRWSSDETQLNMSCTLKLPDSVKDILSGTCNDRRIQRLNAKLQVINQQLEGSVIVNEQPVEESAPSPPIDDGLETRINPTEFRLRLKLLKQKQKIISELSGKSEKKDIPKRPSNVYSIFSKKLYVPLKEYPNYNFAGLILGPKGNTLKKMEKETGATIKLRGKGSKITGKNPPAPNEDMHVMIQSDSQTSLDAAVSMVEKLLVPVDDRHNYHKAAQLRELAEIRGTLTEGGLWEMEPCDICGKSDHPTSDCPLTATASQGNTSFCTLSGSLFSSFKSPSLSPCPIPLVAKTYGEKPKKEIDPANLFVGYLPLSVSIDKLKELFLPYGSICEAIVIVDKITGQSKGYGFVKYTTNSDAAKAIVKMNGYMIDGKKLAVRVAGISPPPLNANMPNHPEVASIPSSFLNANLPNYTGLASIPFISSSNANLPNYLVLSPILPPSSNANLPNYPGIASPFSLNANLANHPGLAVIPREIPEPSCWPAPGSILPESGISFPKSSSNSLPYKESVPLQSLSSLGSTFHTSLGKNGYMMDGKKLEVAFTGTPSPSLNANLPNYSLTGIPPQSLNANLPSYPGFAAIPREIPEPNCWPGPPGSILPESGTYFPKSSHNLLKYNENVPLKSSAYLGSTCQASISSSQFPGFTAASNELASFPGYLNSIDPSDQFDQPLPSSSRSSQSTYFIRNFSGNQMNPTWQ